MAELCGLLPRQDLSAVIQADAAAELPAGVRSIRRPVAAGAGRAMLGMLPVRNADLIHALDVDLPFGAGAVRVATVHDMSVFDTPWAYSRLRAAGERALLRSSLRRADVLLAVSEFTAERVQSIARRSCTVTPLAPARWAVPPSVTQVQQVFAKYGLPERFVLQVGTVEPRKDVALVAQVAAELDVPCVLAGAGSRGPRAPAGVQGLGYVDAGDLPALYRAATVVAYASRYEGFGLPPVEAMACGGVVAASAVGALPQVVGDGAVLVARHNRTDWTTALRPLLRDAAHRDALRQRASAAAARLSWRSTAEQTVAAYRSAGAAV